MDMKYLSFSDYQLKEKEENKVQMKNRDIHYQLIYVNVYNSKLNINLKKNEFMSEKRINVDLYMSNPDLRN